MLIPRKTLEERLAAFNAGDWVQLAETSLEVALKWSEAKARRRRRGRYNNVENRAARALHLMQMDNFPLTRQALEASPIHKSQVDERESQAERAKERAGRQHRCNSSCRALGSAVIFDLDVDKFQNNLRTVRRGAAGGPSGMSVGESCMRGSSQRHSWHERRSQRKS